MARSGPAQCVTLSTVLQVWALRRQGLLSTTVGGEVAVVESRGSWHRVTRILDEGWYTAPNQESMREDLQANIVRDGVEERRDDVTSRAAAEAEDARR